jgi:hypothetical protein
VETNTSPLSKIKFQIHLFPIFAWLVGGALLAAAFSLPAFRDAEGLLSGRFALPFSVGIAFILAAIFRRWAKFAFWLWMGLVGQAVTLQLVQAGKTMSYQHYRPFNQLTSSEFLPFTLFLIVQTVVVLVAIFRRREEITNGLRTHFKWWQIAGILVVSTVFSATVSPSPVRFLSELVLAAFIQMINLLTLILIVWSLPDTALLSLREKSHQVFGRRAMQNGRSAGRPDRFSLLTALWVIVLSAALSFFAYQRHPHIPDEVVYIYQAEFLAAGKLSMPAPPVPEAFDVYLMQFEPARWYPSPPVGWPAMLAVGVLLGVPWLVNPLLAGVNILLTYLLLSELYSRRLARIAILLLALSPWYVFMAMNFMTHTFTLSCALLAALGVIWARNRDQIAWAVLAGIALGVMSLIRPLEGLLWAVLLGLWAIGLGRRRLKISAIAALVVTTGAVAALVFPYNKMLTGEASTFPINAYTDERFGVNSNAYGFGPDRGMGWPIDPFPGHSPLDGLINADLNFFSINIELFGWSTGSLVLAALLLFSGSYRKSDFLMAAVVAAVFAVFFFYYFSGGPDFGARYWFLMIVPLAALSVRGLDYLEDRMAFVGANPAASQARPLAGVLILGVFALVSFFPWRAVDKYFHYLNMRPDMREMASQHQFGKSVVLVRGESQPDYASAAVYNPVDLQSGKTIYVWDRNSQVRRQILEAYSDRPVWFVDGPTLTQSGYEIVQGPLQASEILNHDINVSR